MSILQALNNGTILSRLTCEPAWFHFGLLSNENFAPFPPNIFAS
ncbi:MAG TPA: hypothetical protein VMW38_07145 [Terriglobia bacterium]|nr:hypothetical protein [Terriglobia bacterium]